MTVFSHYRTRLVSAWRKPSKSSILVCCVSKKLVCRLWLVLYLLSVKKMNRRSETTTKVFVGSLPNGVTTEDLRALFAPYGSIAECDISNRCGFLHLEDHDLAMKAIAELNGSNFMGGRISVEKGRVKPRRGPGGGGPMRGGKDRGGPYARNDFRGPPHRNGGGFGGGRDYPPYGGGGDRFGGYDRPQRGGYDGGYGERRPQYDDRRGGGFGGERRPFNNDYDRRPYGDSRGAGFPEGPRGEFEDRRPPPAEYDDRRPLLNDRRPLLDQQGPPPRGPGSFDRAAPVGELYSRRDAGPKPMGGAGAFADRGGYATGSSNGYSGGYGSPAAGAAGGYGSATTAPAGGYGTGGGSFGNPPPQSGGYSDNRGYGTAPGYGNPGGYGDSYGTAAGGRGSYDAAYPPLPQQRGGYF